MTPERTKNIKGHLVREFYWNGKVVVYLDDKLQEGLYFHEVCEKVEKEEGAIT